VLVGHRHASGLPTGTTSPASLHLAQSGGADVHDRMSALGIAAEEIGRAPSVKSDVGDLQRKPLQALFHRDAVGLDWSGPLLDLAGYNRARGIDFSHFERGSWA